MDRSQYVAVLDLLQKYYEGLYRVDIDLLREVFSPNAHYATMADGKLLTLTLDEYLPQLARRRVPADQGVPYGYEVLSVRFVGPSTAVAVLECSLFGRDYADVLSLLRIDGRWRVHAKVFEGTVHPEGAS
ncbi:MAG: nuclear transport factor 2 family protein [Planctomycetota bacterium]